MYPCIQSVMMGLRAVSIPAGMPHQCIRPQNTNQPTLRSIDIKANYPLKCWCQFITRPSNFNLSSIRVTPVCFALIWVLEWHLTKPFIDSKCFPGNCLPPWWSRPAYLAWGWITGTDNVTMEPTDKYHQTWPSCHSNTISTKITTPTSPCMLVEGCCFMEMKNIFTFPQ